MCGCLLLVMGVFVIDDKFLVELNLVFRLDGKFFKRFVRCETFVVASYVFVVFMLNGVFVGMVIGV